MAITRSTRRASAHVAGRARRNLACWSLSRDETQAARLTQAVVAGLTFAVLGTSSTSHAQAWRMTPSSTFESTLTDNVNLAPNDQKKSDWVNQFTPALRFPGKERDRVSRATSRCQYCCMRGRRENNYVAPTVDIAGNAELIEKFLFIDVSANVSQQYQTPFGSVPNNLANATNNRYTAQVYSAKPVPARLAGQQSRLRGPRQQHLVGWQWRRQHERRCVRQFLHQPYHAAADAARLVAVVRPDCAAVSEPAFRAIADRTRQCALSGRPGARAIRHGRLRKQRAAAHDREWRHLWRWRHLASDRPNERRREVGAPVLRRVVQRAVRSSDAAFGLVAACVARHHQLSVSSLPRCRVAPM